MLLSYTLNVSTETESNGYLSLYVKLFHEDGKFVTSVYRKPTFSGNYFIIFPAL